MQTADVLLLQQGTHHPPTRGNTLSGGTIERKVSTSTLPLHRARSRHTPTTLHQHCCVCCPYQAKVLSGTNMNPGERKQNPCFPLPHDVTQLPKALQPGLPPIPLSQLLKFPAHSQSAIALMAKP